MLILGSSFAKMPLLSLRIGTPIGMVVGHLVNPHSLKIDALWCRIGGFKELRLVLICDIREASTNGIIVDDMDSAILPEDVVRLKSIIEIDYNIMNKKVISGRMSIGKVADYAVENGSFYVQKLYVEPNIWGKLTTNRITIDRKQIIEVSPSHVRVSDTEVKSKSTSSVMRKLAQSPVSMPAASTTSLTSE